VETTSPFQFAKVTVQHEVGSPDFQLMTSLHINAADSSRLRLQPHTCPRLLDSATLFVVCSKKTRRPTQSYRCQLHQ